MHYIVGGSVLIDCIHKTGNSLFQTIELVTLHTAGLVQHQYDIQRGRPSRLLGLAGHPGFELNLIGVAIFSGRLDEICTESFLAALYARIRIFRRIILCRQHVERQ